MSGLYLPGSVEIGFSDNGDELAAKFDRARRNRIAEGFAFALVSSGSAAVDFGAETYVDIAQEAVCFADALIAELDK